MNGHPVESDAGLSGKIAALVRERGWCQTEFAQRAGLSRQTAREILEGLSRRRLRNRTVFGCARALGLSVAELQRPLEPGKEFPEGMSFAEDWRYDLATQPRVKDWLENAKSEAARYSHAEIEELLSMQGTGGPLTEEGLTAARRLLDRKRELIRRVQAIAGTEYLGLLESMVSWLFQRVQPYAE
jgi:transcriptional regulator with XRE-family HTH domain